MKNWLHKNFRLIIVIAFIIPILTVAIVSISHVTKWYGISNPISWSIYLSVGIEIAALSSMAAIAANMGKKVYFPFIIATIIQFIGNIFFSYMYIDSTSPEFISWVELVSPILSFIGVESTDIIAHKRFLAFFSGGMLPIISLTFLHMLVKFTEGEELKKEQLESTTEEKTTTLISDPQNLMSEITRIRPTEDELDNMERILSEIQRRKDERSHQNFTPESEISIPEKEETSEIDDSTATTQDNFQVDVVEEDDDSTNLENEKKKF